jgi:hypothetical protein
MDISRLRNSELAAAVGGIALFVFLFFDWYGGEGAFGEGSLSGWDALAGDVTGFVVALTAVAGVALGVLAAADRKVNMPPPRGCGTAALASLSVAIILWRMLADPVGADLKIGIFLGLAAAVAVAAGAVIALREDGFEPLVAAGRGRARASRGSAPRGRTARTTAARKSSGRSGGSKRTSTKRAGARKSGSSATRSRASGTTRRSRSRKK